MALSTEGSTEGSDVSQATMLAVQTTGDPESPLAVATRLRPTPRDSEALIRVAASSLNAGELRRARGAPVGQSIGWDLAGTVVRSAADGSGPPEGARVVTFVSGRAWAEYVAAETRQLGLVPDEVSFTDAAALPVAGLTALRALRRGGDILGKRVLVAPATGGVGLFALQLARLRGAHVTAVIRDDGDRARIEQAGADQIVVGSTADAKAGGPYDLILESLGGESLGAALASLAPDGTVVHFGQTLSPQSTFNSAAFYATGGASLYGFILFHEAARDPVGRDLGILARLVGAGRLHTQIDATYPLTDIAAAAAALRDRRVTGKIALTIGESPSRS